MVMKGWFDAFRNDGGPTLYTFNNRTAVTGDVTIITFLTIFATIYVVFLIIFPGIRKERFTTFFTVSLSLFVGATILVSMFGSAWHVAHSPIISTYKAFSKEKLAANIGVFVGLRHINITLQAFPTTNKTLDIDFNEQFVWGDTNEMGNSFREAVERGLPFPILTVAEYFTLGQDGLFWGGQYKAAGYYATLMLWTSFAVWVLMNLMLVVVPRYGALLMTACGFFLLATVCGYFGMLPETPLVIHIEGKNFYFSFGWCYWLVLLAGGVCLLAGVIITAIEIIFPHSFSTILEVDYDTPYDRHVIIEDSHGKRFQKKRNSGSKLEDSVGGLGSRIFRRLSSKTKEEKLHSGNSEPISQVQDFKMECNEPPWSYRDMKVPMQTLRIPKLGSQDSISTISRNSHYTHHSDISRYRIPPDRVQEGAMW